MHASPLFSLTALLKTLNMLNYTLLSYFPDFLLTSSRLFSDGREMVVMDDEKAIKGIVVEMALFNFLLECK